MMLSYLSRVGVMQMTLGLSKLLKFIITGIVILKHCSLDSVNCDTRTLLLIAVVGRQPFEYAHVLHGLGEGSQLGHVCIMRGIAGCVLTKRIASSAKVTLAYNAMRRATCLSSSLCERSWANERLQVVRLASVLEGTWPA